MVTSKCAVLLIAMRSVQRMQRSQIMKNGIIIALLTCLACLFVDAAELSGVPRIVDGDTLAIGAIKVRLEGIDAPETDQLCLSASGNRWACGVDARDKLAAHIAGRSISCSSSGSDAYHRTLGTCFLVAENLNAWIVQQGWALAYVQYSSAYVRDESDARAGRHGLWQGGFIAPWDWRHRNNQTVILGAVSVPAGAQAMLLGPSSNAGAPSPECTIKGNINRNGERIFHVLGQSSYAKINMAIGNGRRWFCKPEEAEAAGWRRALR